MNQTEQNPYAKDEWPGKNSAERPSHSEDVPDHIDIAIASGDAIVRYIDRLNIAMEALNEKIQSYQDIVVQSSYVYDIAKITKDDLVDRRESYDLVSAAKRDVAEKKRSLEYAKNDLKCATRNSTTITGFRMSAMAALKSHRP